MFFSESEGTGISLSESEGTGVRLSESEGTGISMSESEGTGIQSNGHRNNSKLRWVSCWLMLCASSLALADDVYLYNSGEGVFQGVIVDDHGDTHMLEGILEKGQFSGFIVATILRQDDRQLKSVDDGTGHKSVDDGTGSKSVDDGTGGKSVDDGTGGKSVDDGTGGDSVDDGTGQMIVINMNCNNQAKHHAEVEVDDLIETVELNNIHINGQLQSCNAQLN